MFNRKRINVHRTKLLKLLPTFGLLLCWRDERTMSIETIFGYY